MRSNLLHWPVNDTRNATTSTAPPKDVYESVEEKWRVENEEQVNALDAICRDLKKEDEADFQGFMGPLDRFQWRTTASYYMCYFTMRSEAALRSLEEPCDNWAWCLDWQTGPSHRDPRAADGVPFACAAYSFCPDPCCPLRWVSDPQQCASSAKNPCKMATGGPEELEEARRPRCSLRGDKNADFNSITQNRWNTKCPCEGRGLRWESRFGFCVDVDECSEENSCRTNNGEECVNTLGSYTCRCRWGRVRDSRGACVEDRSLRVVLSARRGGAEVESQKGPRSVWDALESVLLPEK